MCSETCRVQRQNNLGRDHRREGRYEVKPRPKTIEKTCAVCSLPFLTAVKQRQACGLICGGVLAKRNGDAARARNAQERRRRTCEQCGVAFLMHKPNGGAVAGRVRAGRFCSQACHAASRRLVCEATG
jgi:hypothetical protein